MTHRIAPAASDRSKLLWMDANYFAPPWKPWLQTLLDGIYVGASNQKPGVLVPVVRLLAVRNHP